MNFGGDVTARVTPNVLKHLGAHLSRSCQPGPNRLQ